MLAAAYALELGNRPYRNRYVLHRSQDAAYAQPNRLIVEDRLLLKRRGRCANVTVLRPYVKKSCFLWHYCTRKFAGIAFDRVLVLAGTFA